MEDGKESRLSSMQEITPRTAFRPKDREGLSRGTIFSTCSNVNCESGLLHFWRSRSAPVFEGGWMCSPACTLARLEAALRREMEGRREEPGAHRHRVPLGLVMLEKGWINAEQLRKALDAQKASGQGRLGNWLVRQHDIPEQLVTRALSLQWNCPVLPLDCHDPDGVAPLLPRLFVDAFGALPLRVAAGKILYLGFEEQLDPMLALSLERMHGLRVEAGVVRGSLFRAAHERMLTAAYPGVDLVDAASGQLLAVAMSRAIEKARPVESRLVRVHDCLWLRLWRAPQKTPIPECGRVHDVICSLRTNLTLAVEPSTS